MLRAYSDEERIIDACRAARKTESVLPFALPKIAFHFVSLSGLMGCYALRLDAPTLPLNILENEVNALAIHIALRWVAIHRIDTARTI